ARAQFAGGQFRIADVEKQKRLRRIDVALAVAVELVLDDVEQAAMQALDQLESFQIKRTKCGFRCRKRSGYVRLALCVDHFFCLSVGAAFHETMMQLSVLFYAVYCFSPS